MVSRRDKTSGTPVGIPWLKILIAIVIIILLVILFLALSP
jgi:hypothetical protein